MLLEYLHIDTFPFPRAGVLPAPGMLPWGVDLHRGLNTPHSPKLSSALRYVWGSLSLSSPLASTVLDHFLCCAIAQEEMLNGDVQNRIPYISIAMQV